MAKDGNEKKDIRADVERRVTKRLNVSLPILLPTGKANTKNISAGGAYLELRKDDVDLYSVGQNIPVWVHASYGSNVYFSQQLWLFVNAIVVRKEKLAPYPVPRYGDTGAVCTAQQSDKWGVGLMFNGKLDLMLSTVNGFY